MVKYIKGKGTARMAVLFQFLEEENNMQRTVKKQFWLNREEAEDLADKAKRTCLTEAALLRLLIKGAKLKEQPGDKFFKAMDEMSRIGYRINQIAIKAHSYGFIDAPMLEEEIRKLNKFQLKIERAFLNHDGDKTVWR